MVVRTIRSGLIAGPVTSSAIADAMLTEARPLQFAPVFCLTQLVSLAIAALLLASGSN